MEITVTQDRGAGNESQALARLAKLESNRDWRDLNIDVTDQIFDFVYDRLDDRDERKHAMFVRVTNPDTGRVVKAVCSFEYDSQNGIEAIKFTVQR